jgi:hypothetical protein
VCVCVCVLTLDFGDCTLAPVSCKLLALWHTCLFGRKQRRICASSWETKSSTWLILYSLKEALSYPTGRTVTQMRGFSACCVRRKLMIDVGEVVRIGGTHFWSTEIIAIVGVTAGKRCSRSMWGTLQRCAVNVSAEPTWLMFCIFKHGVGTNLCFPTLQFLIAVPVLFNGVFEPSRKLLRTCGLI